MIIVPWNIKSEINYFHKALTKLNGAIDGCTCIFGRAEFEMIALYGILVCHHIRIYTTIFEIGFLSPKVTDGKFFLEQ